MFFSTLRDGTKVLAKSIKSGEPVPVTFMNRTQAQARLDRLDQPCFIYQPRSGKVFYVALDTQRGEYKALHIMTTKDAEQVIVKVVYEIEVNGVVICSFDNAKQAAEMYNEIALSEEEARVLARTAREKAQLVTDEEAEAIGSHSKEHLDEVKWERFFETVLNDMALGISPEEALRWWCGSRTVRRRAREVCNGTEAKAAEVTQAKEDRWGRQEFLARYAAILASTAAAALERERAAWWRNWRASSHSPSMRRRRRASRA